MMLQKMKHEMLMLQDIKYKIEETKKEYRHGLAAGVDTQLDAILLY